MTDRYIVTVEYEVFADSRSNAVRKFFIGNERYLTVRDAVKTERQDPDPLVYHHEQTFYEDGEPSLSADFQPASWER